ncbi:uncharacterized protein LOC113498898 isoform X2 [Trichoplusia ni]|uniref:Uncharacterized protein LOC113498898 isoform X2 n=1 Tax=Trichoplusia ni TaxID=7111 RepID=A0A7E5W2P5_TRINI|nr:uncharacterized protein LOC113498898 isoform X2 [Trichoplusia ni]
MESVTDHLKRLREERIAREKARIEKLRELNLKKVAVKNHIHVNTSAKRPSSVPVTAKPRQALSQVKLEGKSSSLIPGPSDKVANKTTNAVKTTTSAPKVTVNQKPSAKTDKSLANDSKTTGNTIKRVPNNEANKSKTSLIPNNTKKVLTERKPDLISNLGCKQGFPIRKDNMTTNLKLRKSLAVTNTKPEPIASRKSMIPKIPGSSMTSQSAPQNSVFERLYKPKYTQENHVNDVKKLQTDPDYLKKVIRTSGLILNKRHTVFEATKPKAAPVRRSISAVHFKRIGKHELSNCIQKFSSIGEKLNSVHLKHINEDENVKDEVVSAIRSERKKVKFMTPMSSFNTPRPEELQGRLKSWLAKRGKSLDSYHHLQCFGIHHLPHTINFDPKQFDEENKENIAVESDSDDDSYTETMNEEIPATKQWRNVSSVNDSVDLNESHDTTATCSDVVNTDNIVVGALNDLTEILREGYDWQQCARWLRAIRERFPACARHSAYWECRAALEEARGDLPASVQCWEEAIANGTEHTVAEASLDHLLDKFMQLKISPNSGKRQPDPKFVDMKNVFKSTIIRFAVQQAKLSVNRLG